MLNHEIPHRPARHVDASEHTATYGMPYRLVFSVSGYIGMSESQIMNLERKLTEHFYNPTIRLDSTISLYADMWGDVSLQMSKLHLLMYRLRAAISPQLDFHIELDFGEFGRKEDTPHGGNM